MGKNRKGQTHKIIRKFNIMRKVQLALLLLVALLTCYRLRKTVTVAMCGRLGNQMFQYACGYALAKRNHLRLQLLPGVDAAVMLQHFNICADIDRHVTLTRLLHKVHLIPLLAENPRMDFEPRVLKPHHAWLWSYGCWQDERYFADCASDIRARLQITTPASPQTEQLLNEITQCCAVSIHVRRGDYVDSWRYTKPTLAYYQKACEHIAKQCGSKPTFYVFSDDAAWVAQHFLPQFAPQRDIHLASDADISEIDDLRAMSACRHHIIANSTFSWWGAWLNPSEDKIVVSPYRWFSASSGLSELTLPPSWVRLKY